MPFFRTSTLGDITRGGQTSLHFYSIKKAVFAGIGWALLATLLIWLWG